MIHEQPTRQTTATVNEVWAYGKVVAVRKAE